MTPTKPKQVKCSHCDLVSTKGGIKHHKLFLKRKGQYKVCNICSLKVKRTPEELAKHFYPHPNTGDRYFPHCKQCAGNLQRSPQRKCSTLKAIKKYTKKNPDKVKQWLINAYDKMTLEERQEHNRKSWQRRKQKPVHITYLGKIICGKLSEKVPTTVLRYKPVMESLHGERLCKTCLRVVDTIANCGINILQASR